VSVLGTFQPGDPEELRATQNRLLWREDAIRDRVCRMVRVGDWPPQIGFLLDLLADDFVLPEGDFLESLKPKPKPKLVEVTDEH
jgi:hypothetical protein